MRIANRLFQRFSSSSSSPHTFTISQTAAQQIKKLTNSSTPHLRVAVDSGGCHGYQYLITLDNTLDKDDDIAFTASNGAKVVVDTSSLKLVDGSQLDWIDELIGTSFQIVNPRATTSCGCKISFNID